MCLTEKQTHLRGLSILGNMTYFVLKNPKLSSDVRSFVWAHGLCPSCRLSNFSPVGSLTRSNLCRYRAVSTGPCSGMLLLFPTHVFPIMLTLVRIKMIIYSGKFKNALLNILPENKNIFLKCGQLSTMVRKKTLYKKITRKNDH